MKLKVMRPLVSRALQAVLLVSLLPLQLVPAAQPQSPKSAQPRGKNGTLRGASSLLAGNPALHKSFVSGTSALTSKNVVQQSSADPTTVPGQGEESDQPSSAGRDDSDLDQPTANSIDQSSDQSSASSGGQTGSDQPSARPRRREPPPFDRPPAKSGQNQGSTSTTNDSRTSDSGRASRDRSQSGQRDTSQSQPDRGSSPGTRAGSDRGGSNNDYDTDDDQVDRTGRQRPVLRRESEARNTQDPPVLRKPSEQDSPDTSSSSRRTPGGNDRGAGGQGSGDDDVVRLESTLVNIPLLVSDRAGRYIPQLSKRDFMLWEDGAPQEIASFGSEQVPFKVALLLDVSPSVQGSIRDIQDAAIEFVRQLRSQDEVMVVSFDHNAHLLCDFTNNRAQLESAIRSASMGSGTSVYESVYEVVARRLRGVEGRKALILFSDGEDTTSRRVGYDDAVNIVTESDVLVYGLRYPGTDSMPGNWPWPGRRNPYPQIPNIPNIPFPFPWPRRRGPIFHSFPTAPPASPTTGSAAAPQSWPRRGGRGDFMADITAAGGGPVFDAQSVGDMRALAARIAEELRHVYVISYYPTNPLSNGGYRSIRVKVRNRDDIAVRHRRGYNASSNSNVH